MINMCGITLLVSPYFSKDPIYGSPLATSPSAVRAEGRQESCKNTCSHFRVIMSTLFLESRESRSKTLQHVKTYLRHSCLLTIMPSKSQSSRRGSGRSLASRKGTHSLQVLSCRGVILPLPWSWKAETKISQAEIFVADGCSQRITERHCLPRERSKN